MLKFLKNSLIILVTLISVLSIVSCSAAKPAATATRGRTITVTRGDLAINVSVDGNLNMPNEYDLRFGAPGQVKYIYVQDGDTVKAGQILATLDDKTERQGLETSSNSLQQTLSSLYETIPLTPQISGYNESLLTTNASPGPYTNTFWIPAPAGSTGGMIINPTAAPQYYYSLPNNIDTDVTTPNPPTYFASASALEAFAWGGQEVYNAQQLLASDNSTWATSQLNMAADDLESCALILQDAVNNPQSGMGNTARYFTDNNTWSFLLQNPQNGATSNIMEVRNTIDLLRQREDDVQQAQKAISDNSTEAGPLLNDLMNELVKTSSAVYSNVDFIKVYYTYPFPFQDITQDFYGKAQDSLTKVLNTAQQGQFNSISFFENLTLARHYMELCNSFLGSNEIDLQHGLSQPNEQNFKVNLSKSEVGVENANLNLLNSVIIAPVDGIVVNVGIKANDVLSNQNYSSVQAVLMVDTSTVEFDGQVDEIDITKVKDGQKVNISVDAVPNQAFTGNVTFISPYGNTVGNVQKFNIKIALDHTSVPLKGGLSATADIAVDSLKNVLLLPVSAITTTSTGSSVTWLNPKTGLGEQRNITIGQENLQYAEITSGLSEGDQIIVGSKTNSAVVSGFPSPSQQSTQQSGGPSRGPGGGG